MNDYRFLELLSERFPNADSVTAEIINLSSICELPKGTEYFFSDIHGESDAFLYQLKTACGVIKNKIDYLFSDTMDEPNRLLLGELIYSTERVLKLQHMVGIDDEWYSNAIKNLIKVLKSVNSKYTRSRVKKLMPKNYAYVIDELLHADTEESREDYYQAVVNSIIITGIADDFITSICNLIQRCAVKKLYIIGDIFDRGPHPDIVIDELIRFKEVDIQWGNHDIHWMGAACGNECCVASVIRMAMSYNNFDLIEDGYGINLRPLSSFASEVYRDDKCEIFYPHLLDDNLYDNIDADLVAKMHKAIAVIGFKLEGQLIMQHPEYQMDSRNLLKNVNFEDGTVFSGGKNYKMKDMFFPTIDPKDPLKLTEREKELVHTLTRSFTHSPQLNRHIRFLYNNGFMYTISNGNLLYHGCIPMERDGSFKAVSINGKSLHCKELLDEIDTIVRNAYYLPEDHPDKERNSDFMWYLWCSNNSPLFGKSRMATFERYFIDDKETHTELSNPYYDFSDDREACEHILRSFGLDPAVSRIINGHVPVKKIKGESPVKAEGLLYVIDGGISKAYQETTGMGGYTLLFNSHYIALAEHKPYLESRSEAFGEPPAVKIVERFEKRVKVADTDDGKRIKASITDLKDLLAAYKSGDIKEKN